MRIMKQNAKTKEFCDSEIVEVTQEFIDDYLIYHDSNNDN